jgi:hypothetical protein
LRHPPEAQTNRLWPSTLASSFHCSALAAQGHSGSVTAAASLAFLCVSVDGVWSPEHLGGTPSARRPGWKSAPGPVRATTLGNGSPGVVARSDVDARLTVVQVRPGGVAPAGRRHRNQRRDIGRQPLAAQAQASPSGWVAAPATAASSAGRAHSAATARPPRRRTPPSAAALARVVLAGARPPPGSGCCPCAPGGLEDRDAGRGDLSDPVHYDQRLHLSRERQGTAALTRDAAVEFHCPLNSLALTGGHGNSRPTRRSWTRLDGARRPWVTPSPSTTPSLVRRSPEFIQPCCCCFDQPCIRHVDTG